MLEAVNTSLQSSVVNKAAVEQVSPVDSFAGNPDRIQKAAPSTDYTPSSLGTLFIHVDTNFDTAVLQVRNSSTKDVLRQFPSEPTLQARQRAEQARVEAEKSTADVGQGQTNVQRPQVQQTQQTQQFQSTPSIQPTAQQLSAFSSAATSGTSQTGQVTVFA